MAIHRTLGAAWALCAALLAAPAFAGELYVISNNALNLPAEEIRDVFLGDKQVADGVKLVPIDNAALQGEFLGKVVKVDSAKYATIWAKKGFRDGLNPPPVKSGDAEVIAAVKATPGGVGYVSSKPAALRVLQKY
jgi:ABC-type phosphate transport system substrate-binding protein